MGSFTSFPLAFAATRLKIPLFLHDGNARIGRANRFLSRWAKLLMTAFPPVNHDSIKCPYEYTGMPLRPEILSSKSSKIEATKRFNAKHKCSFDPKIPTILVFGGSQGAATINRVIPKTISALQDKKLQVMHLVGKNDFAEVKSVYERGVNSSFVMESCDNMSLLYSVSDFVVCRSGGSTIAELAFFEKSAILIPFPLASDLHQNDNAEFYAQSGLAEIVYNKDCTEAKMQQVINEHLLKIQKGLTKPLTGFKKTGVADRILQLIFNRSS
jgi:UDP-N-acetylglucosamine:LPS N-acetylglucosamine transferase